MRGAVGSALLNLLIWLSTLVFGILPLSPLWFTFIVLVASPAALLGYLTSDDAVGLPQWWLRARSFPYVIPLVALWDLPVGLYLFLCCIIGTFILTPVAHVAFSVGRALCGSRRSAKIKCTTSVSAPPAALNLPAAQATAPHHDSDRYKEHASIWAAIEGGTTAAVQPGDVRLLSLAWLMALADTGGVLPRRQDLPEEAFIDAAHLRRIEAGAKRGTDLEGFRDDVAALAEGQGSSLLDFLKIITGLFRRKRNVDRLLPIVSIS